MQGQLGVPTEKNATPGPILRAHTRGHLRGILHGKLSEVSVALESAKISKLDPKLLTVKEKNW